MNLISIIFWGLPIALLVSLFIGIVKKNKRLWITSLIFFIVIVLFEFAYFYPAKTTDSSDIHKTNSIN